MDNGLKIVVNNFDIINYHFRDKTPKINDIIRNPP